MDDVTQQNAALVEQAAAAAESMEEQAQELNRLMLTFTLSKPAPALQHFQKKAAPAKIAVQKARSLPTISRNEEGCAEF